jgi:tungstate transport system ATP-binding protein
MADVEVRRGSRRLLAVPALEIRSGEVLAVIGPNGAGKSTLLRVLNLLEPPTCGTVAFHGRVAGREAERRALRRRMAAVFQEPLLCDTTVGANVRLPLAFRGLPGAEAERRARPWLERFGIGHLAARSARSLSGGEAQRASLARAFATAPEVLFLDEPLAALDPPTREDLVRDLGRILGESHTTTVLVTHDRAEALALGDRVAVLLEGRLAQVGVPAAVFGAPADEAVARLVGVENLLAGEVASVRDGLVEVTVSAAPGRPSLVVAGTARIGERVLVGLRPEDVFLEAVGSGGPASAQNRFVARVVEIVPLGPLYRVVVEGGVRLTGLVTRPAILALDLAPGVSVGVSFKATAAHLVRRGGAGAGGSPLRSVDTRPPGASA